MVIEVLDPQPAKPEEALIPDFMQHVEGNSLPMKGVFKDLPGGRHSRWRWSCGDGKESVIQHPVNYYPKTGFYRYATPLHDTGLMGVVSLETHEQRDSHCSSPAWP